jgi:predicted phosphodiesterase
LAETATEASAKRRSGLNDLDDRIRRFRRIMAVIEQETARSGQGVLVSVQDRETSLVQSAIAERSDAGVPLHAGGLEAKFGQGTFGGDVWGWFTSLFDHIDQREWHPIVRPPDAVVDQIADKAEIAVMGDWGTNLYGAPVSAASIKAKGGYELLVHLGDIYYSGTKAEVQQRFLQVWPGAAAKLNRALNGNHEMYSGGFAYFDDILPKFQQRSSYFALGNQNWLLIGLDTAHADHDLDDEQVAWLHRVLQSAGQRKLILFSHHQPFSSLATQGPKLITKLADILAARKVTAWYWGHEHECIIYERHQSGMLGRCIGHGGIPEPRKFEVRDAPTARNMHGIAWKKLAANSNAPGCLVLDGPNPLIPGEEEKFGPHGYLTLSFDGAQLVERVHLPDGTEIFSGHV